MDQAEEVFPLEQPPFPQERGEGVVVEDPEEAGEGAAALSEDAALRRGVDEGHLGPAGGVQAGQDDVADREVTPDPVMYF